MRPTCEPSGAGAIGRCSPCVLVSTNLLNPTSVETLVCPRHIKNPQPEHLSLRFLIQAKLWLRKSPGVVAVQLQFLDAPLHDKELGGLKRRRWGGDRGGRRRGSGAWGKEPAKDEDAAAPLPLRYQAGECQVVFLWYHDNRPGAHRHVQGLTYFCGQKTNSVSDVSRYRLLWLKYTCFFFF